ncbi:MAG: hypothetical protein WBP85_02010, partial [Terracidiphilus sp.]
LAVIGGVKDDKELKSFQVLHFQPFDPVHKRTEAKLKKPSRRPTDSRRYFPSTSTTSSIFFNGAATS